MKRSKAGLESRRSCAASRLRSGSRTRLRSAAKRRNQPKRTHRTPPDTLSNFTQDLTISGRGRPRPRDPASFGDSSGTRPSPPVRLRGQWDRAVEVRFCAVKSRAVSNRNCVAAMRGGEQRNENDQSVTQTAQAGGRGELDSVGVDGRAFERVAKPVGAGVNPLAAGRSPVVALMVGDGMAGSPLCRNQGDPPGSNGVHGGSARRTARRESERP